MLDEGFAVGLYQSWGSLSKPLNLWESGGKVLDRVAEIRMGTVAAFGDFRRTNCQILKQITSI